MVCPHFCFLPGLLGLFLCVWGSVFGVLGLRFWLCCFRARENWGQNQRYSCNQLSSPVYATACSVSVSAITNRGCNTRKTQIKHTSPTLASEFLLHLVISHN